MLFYFFGGGGGGVFTKAIKKKKAKLLARITYIRSTFKNISSFSRIIQLNSGNIQCVAQISY